MIREATIILLHEEDHIFVHDGQQFISLHTEEYIVCNMNSKYRSIQNSDKEETT